MAKKRAHAAKKAEPVSTPSAEPVEPIQDAAGGENRQQVVRYDVSAEDFCRVWTAAQSADEVAEKLQMPKPIVYARASKYREKGIPLKNMPRGAKRGLDVESLKSLVQMLNKQHNVPASQLDGSDEAPDQALTDLGPEPIDVNALAAAVAKALIETKKAPK